jgi:hypothetical protein
VCGRETDEKSTWLTIGGPLKGAYAVIDFNHLFIEFVSDFGIRVDDPCKAHDDTENIYLNPEQTTFKDLKFH